MCPSWWPGWVALWRPQSWARGRGLGGLLCLRWQQAREGVCVGGYGGTPQGRCFGQGGMASTLGEGCPPSWWFHSGLMQ